MQMSYLGASQSWQSRSLTMYVVAGTGYPLATSVLRVVISDFFRQQFLGGKKVKAEVQSPNFLKKYLYC